MRRALTGAIVGGLLCAGAGLALETPDPFGPSTLQARALRGLTGEVASLILRAEPGGEIEMEALAVPLLEPAGSETDAQRVAVFVEIDGTSFLELNQAETARLEIYVYALSEEGFQVADYRAEVTAVDVGRLGEIVWQSGLKYYGELSLPPGRYRLRALVRNYQSQVAGLREVPVEVPEKASLLTPVFPDPEHREPWLPVRAWRDDLLTGLIDEPLEELKARTARPYAFYIGEEAIRPAARPILVPGRSSSVYLRGRLPEGATAQLKLVAPTETNEAETAENTPTEETILATVPLEIRDRVDQGGRTVAEAHFLLPEDLAPGPADLRVDLTVGADVLSSPSIPGHVVASDTREQNLLWSDLRWRGSAVPRDEAAPDSSSDRMVESPRRRGGRKAEKLGEEYRQILAEIEELGDATALSRMLDFETRVLNEGSRKASAQLQVGEFGVIEALAESDPESLVPLIQLHQDLYLAYRGRRLFSLGTHSRVIMERAAELYAEKGSGQGARIVAARALTSLGGYLQAGGLAATSQRLFRRALELDPTSETALLALACGYERLGAYDRAADALEQLVLHHPKSSEGWLRLAMSTARLGNRPRSKELLEKVVALDGPPWIRSLAYEELARVHLVLDRVDTSLELLEKIPEPSPGTVVLIAYLYDRLGSPKRSLQLLSEIRADPGRGPSPRKLYDGWPESALAGTRNDLLEAADVRLNRLQDLVEKKT